MSLSAREYLQQILIAWDVVIHKIPALDAEIRRILAQDYL